MKAHRTVHRLGRRLLPAVITALLLTRFLPIWTPIYAAVAFVQEKDTGVDFSGSVTLATTLTSAAGAGHCLAIWIVNGTQTITASVAGNGNTYTAVDGPTDEATTLRGWTFYAKNINAGSTTVTVTFSAAPSASRLLVHEISGCDPTAPLDQHAINPQTNAGAGANAYTSTAKTTTANGEYIFGVSSNDAADDYNAGTGFTLRTQTAVANQDPTSEDQVQGTAGSIAATFTMKSAGGFNGSLTGMLTFKAAAGGAPACGNLRLLGVGCL